MKRWSIPAGLVTLAAAAPLAWAQAPARAARPEVSAQAVEQKTQMVDRMVYNSPVAARIGGSQNADARRHFGNARDLLVHARALTVSGQLRAADLLLNEAIWEMGRAQQLAPDERARLVEERARFQQLADSVDALVAGYPAQGARPDVQALLERVRTTRQQARASADDGRVVEANRQLEGALALLLKDSLARFEGQTLVYDRRFASTREEFGFELARHRSYEGLVPLALLEYRPSAEARSLIERYVGQARALRERAEAQAAGGDAATALNTLGEGTDALQRALQAAGLAVPQTMGSP